MYWQNQQKSCFWPLTNTNRCYDIIRRKKRNNTKAVFTKEYTHVQKEEKETLILTKIYNHKTK